MRSLSSPLRKKLEIAVLTARRASESACRAAIDGLGVFADRRPDHLDADRAALRNGLRAKWRQLGDDRSVLLAECSYEQWHRLLFARFLAENRLLLHPQYRAPVTLADCEELAAVLGEPDGWSVAARFAAEILPGIFRLDDPCVLLRLAPEGRHALEQALDSLPAEVFVADDALGWVYQFWQKDKKDEINASERKIGGADLGPVTQLFTENYMVRFLLENSLGAWWAARHPHSPLVKGFDYLRFDDDGRPAAGSFDGWPARVAEVTVMDPCCGSGHFLVEAFSMLWRMRAEEEGFSPVDAQDAVLRDNLFGLELDPRCVQIAMFAVAMQAWKAGGRWRELPVPKIACSGIPVKATVGEWKDLGDGDQRLENVLVRLHILFRDAETLGSLIDPRRVVASEETQRSLDDLDWHIAAPLLEKAVSGEGGSFSVLGADAAGVAFAGDLLSRQYSLVATNVPYLGRTRQASSLRSHIDAMFPEGRPDLAAAFILRMCGLVMPDGTWAAVTPQAWQFLKSYEKLRRTVLQMGSLGMIARLGTGAFGQVSGHVVNVGLTILSRSANRSFLSTAFLNAEDAEAPEAKADLLRSRPTISVHHRSHLANPMAMISGEEAGRNGRLGEIAGSYQGISSGDGSRYIREFWELAGIDPGRTWAFIQGPTSKNTHYGGRSRVILWEEDRGLLRSAHDKMEARIRGTQAWGRIGVALSQMGTMHCTLYKGNLFDNSSTAIIPTLESDQAALYHFFGSNEFTAALRRISPKMSVEVATVGMVPIDIHHWRRVADQAGPLPEPSSTDPTQWLFQGRPEVSPVPLQVAVGRLLGYRWPDQEADDLDALVDADGIVCLPSVAGEALAADRVQKVLSVAFGDEWSPGRVKELLEQAGSKRKNLANWLRDEFFKQHCALFGNRPFVWHVWDGQRDGFSALVNYHRLDRRTLEKLTYTYLGQDWVERQRAEARDDIAGAEARLGAALDLQRKLEAILEGEKPLDIFVRWKDLQEQPMGWDPDLNDGVRLNIRPFVEAGVLRASFNIHWKKDRGKNPDGSERHNYVHLSFAEKGAARKRAGRA